MKKSIILAPLALVAILAFYGFHPGSVKAFYDGNQNQVYTYGTYYGYGGGYGNGGSIPYGISFGNSVYTFETYYPSNASTSAYRANTNTLSGISYNNSYPNSNYSNYSNYPDYSNHTYAQGSMSQGYPQNYGYMNVNYINYANSPTITGYNLYDPSRMPYNSYNNVINWRHYRHH